MRLKDLVSAVILIAKIDLSKESHCGCKVTRECYEDMIDALLDRDETPCIEDAALGSGAAIFWGLSIGERSSNDFHGYKRSTRSPTSGPEEESGKSVDYTLLWRKIDVLSGKITIFLKALVKFCGDIIEVKSEAMTFEGRNLYEVSIARIYEDNIGPKPVIIIEAGQCGGYGPVDLALFVIEQLVACEEYDNLIEGARWVILPCTNPDGFEYCYNNVETWYKNKVRTNGSIVDGVDISRNFNESWNICPNTGNVYSQHYPGAAAATEVETLFMINIFNKYSSDLKAYLSLRRDGHSILYPYASINGSTDTELTKKKAGDIAAKVNYRAGTVQWFANDSIYNMNGKPHCGHSVDYAFINLHVPYAYEMRVFLESDRKILNKYQKLPLGYKTSLRNAYFSGIKELYNAVVNENKRNNIF